MSNSETMNTLASNIRSLLRARGLRQQDLSEMTGIDRPNISRLLTSESANPQLSTLVLIANALDVTVCDLLSENCEKVAC